MMFRHYCEKDSRKESLFLYLAELTLSGVVDGGTVGNS